MKYPCHAPGCEKSAQTCSCMSCDEPWLFDFCSRECWDTVDLVDHLRAEADMLNTIAAQEIEKRDIQIKALRVTIDALTEQLGVMMVDLQEARNDAR